MSLTAPNHETAIVARTIGPENTDLSQDAARWLLTLKLTVSDRERVNGLVAKARDGSLNNEDRIELNEYERVASLLELLQSKARRSLGRGGLAK